MEGRGKGSNGSVPCPSQGIPFFFFFVRFLIWFFFDVASRSDMPLLPSKARRRGRSREPQIYWNPFKVASSCRRQRERKGKRWRHLMRIWNSKKAQKGRRVFFPRSYTQIQYPHVLSARAFFLHSVVVCFLLFQACIEYM